MTRSDWIDVFWRAVGIAVVAVVLTAVALVVAWDTMRVRAVSGAGSGGSGRP